ncbi:hypothetical protein F2P56_030684 [Juglans regia]|uniref:Reverse transcriptase Ty1/copia-type domain-containing protein n=1 Tax=Juglans regia TaxID=51240 RepID=A0A833WI11_JUGRE|nr:hypothetical protein F2P56_030684 [Juglans regia]
MVMSQLGQMMMILILMLAKSTRKGIIWLLIIFTDTITTIKGDIHHNKWPPWLHTPTPSHEDNTWPIDSGANQHVTGDLSNLHLAEPHNRGDKVAVGNVPSADESLPGPTLDNELHIDVDINLPSVSPDIDLPPMSLEATYTSPIDIPPSNATNTEHIPQKNPPQHHMEVMQQEYDALLANATWDLVPRPSNHNVIRTKWVYKVKQKLGGSLDLYKARLVVKGFQQIDGVDFTETSSPVIKPTTIQITLTSHFQQEFTFKSLVNLDYFLGIEASHDAHGLHLRQKLSTGHGERAEDVTSYRQVVGALQYYTLTQSEIAYSINQLCQHLHAPTEIHWKSAKRVLRYLKGTIDHGLYFNKGILGLTAYCDVDWARDATDRTESEYRTLAMVVAELYWIQMLLKDLHIPLFSPPTVWYDNQSALALAANLAYHARTKHIEVDFHFIREEVVNGDVKLCYIFTIDQIGDLFTKGLSSARFQMLRDKLMGWQFVFTGRIRIVLTHE